VSPPLVAAQGLGRRRNGGGWLLCDLSLRLAAGDRLALGGPSGAGKSLLLRSLALLDPVDSGTVLWRGREIPDTEVPAFRSQVLYLHQRPPLFPGSVADNLRRVLSLQVHRERSFDRTWATGRLERLGRDESFLELRADRLSGGEAQIMALLRAMQLEPAVLLLDEPTAGVDDEAAAAIESLVDDWFRRDESQRALIWVSHDSLQLRRIGNRGLEIRHGELIAQDTP